MDRRSFLATAAAAATVPAFGAKSRLNSTMVSAISDEIARSPAEAIEFAHKFGMQWLSLRDMPAPLGTKKTAYYSLEPAALRQVAKEFKDAGVKVAFLDTPFLKYDL